ncbi:phage tail assembly chaperone family protein, TAC [Pseudomonas hunanensis]|uniref:phage tail assembly chaperone family protein, TAC n=1 Tax=Pseudomonas hunanensis TaxID=1247546 RepID=UPI0024065CB2|nr:phage tail assembly chaperone family protein, TAC [Pseudomonas hunanensis]MDF9755465.1 hypothetical protein [Pseudomonas hunanensis]
MNINQLKALGGIVDSQRVRKEVVWNRPDPQTGEMLAQTLVVHVRRHSFGVIERLFAEQASSHSRNAHYLAASISLGEEGEEPLGVEDRVQPRTLTGLRAAQHHQRSQWHR